MGHERLGVLPKTKPWRDIIASISDFGGAAPTAAEIASKTARNVQSRFPRMAADSGVRAAFEFLVALAASSLNEERAEHLRGLGVDLGEETTPLALLRALQRWVERNRDSLEYATLAQAAAGDTIVGWWGAPHCQDQKALGLR